MNKPIITVRDMNLWYGQTQALKNINIDIPERSITALIGPSGCGKSTFLKSLNRMQDLVPSVKITGDIYYQGQDIFGAEVNNLRKEIGMVFQKPNPFPMSIYDNIAYGPRTHGITNKAQLDEIVEKALHGAAIWDEVKDRLKKNALGLSGGQQQRLCIARALAVERNHDRSALLPECPYTGNRCQNAPSPNILPPEQPHALPVPHPLPDLPTPHKHQHPEYRHSNDLSLRSDMLF